MQVSFPTFFVHASIAEPDLAVHTLPLTMLAQVPSVVSKSLTHLATAAASFFGAVLNRLAGFLPQVLARRRSAVRIVGPAALDGRIRIRVGRAARAAGAHREGQETSETGSQQWPHRVNGSTGDAVLCASRAARQPAHGSGQSGLTGADSDMSQPAHAKLTQDAAILSIAA